ncbi:MAG: long-chain acyl-CoA synthetase [Saprospiraceae bacterium]|jgi:long-chain acyl-CoA synthetase
MSHPAYQEFDESAVPPHMISLNEALTLDGLFRARVKRSPNKEAYRFFNDKTHQWQGLSWIEVDAQVRLWQKALTADGLSEGDRVAVMMENCLEWIIFDQAALGLGLVVVPLYANDRADNSAYILENSGSKLLLIQNQEQANQLASAANDLSSVMLRSVSQCESSTLTIQAINDWIAAAAATTPPKTHDHEPHSMASIVYTSGTTGQPKGVMLSHKNILWNAWSGMHSVMVTPDDTHLSFLPLSHTLERTVGYYFMMMAGAKVAFNRSIPELVDDLAEIKPTIMITVPRIFERVYGRINDTLESESTIKRFLFKQAVKTGWQRFQYDLGRKAWSPRQIMFPLLDKLVGQKVRDRLGGRVRIAIVGGAAMPAKIAEFFLGLGIPILQGYGLTETSPILSVNTHENNLPHSVGPLLRNVKARFDDVTGELIVFSPGIMKGYWQNEAATADDMTDDGWLRTGDVARFEGDSLVITGRLKEILVLANGEKVPPADIESALILDPLIEQSLVIGEGKPYLSALIVIEAEEKAKWQQRHKDNSDAALRLVLESRIKEHLSEFPGYARIYQFAIMEKPWTIEDETLTPTLKVRRKRVLEKSADIVASLYEGHS